MSDRIQCLVPGCRCTAARRRFVDGIRPEMEWICQKHWVLVPRDLRQNKTRAARRKKPLAANYWWRKCREAAIAENFLNMN
jgi:hypothetical protein